MQIFNLLPDNSEGAVEVQQLVENYFDNSVTNLVSFFMKDDKGMPDAAKFAALAAGQAVAVAHVPAHELGAAAYGTIPYRSSTQANILST